MIRCSYIILGLLSFAYPTVLHGGFSFVSLNLRNSVTDGSAGPLMVDDDRITTATNPLNHTGVAQVGMNIIESTYAFQWNEDAGLGTFNTDLSHAMRSVDVQTVTRVQVFIEPTEPLHVSVDGEVNFAHMPGDATSVLFGMSVRDFATQNDLFVLGLQGGNGTLLPSSGTLPVHGEAVLSPGTLYRFQAVLDNINFAFPGDSGVLDATGFANFTVTPIPEPASACLLIVAFPLLCRPRR